MKKKYKELLSNTVIFSISNIGAKAILFFMVPLYTAYLSTQAYGEAELITTTSDLLVPILTLGISNAVFRFTFEEKRNTDEILKCFYAIYIPFIAMAALVGVICHGIDQFSVYAIELFLIISLSAFNQSYSLFVKANDHNIVFAINSVLYVIVLCSSNVILLVKYRLAASGYLGAIIIALIVSNAFLLLFGNAKKFVFPRNCDWNLMKEMLDYAAPLIVNSIFWWIITSSDKYMIAFLLSTADVGLYNVATKIPSLVTTFVGVFIEAWTIASFKEYTNIENSFYDNVFKVFNCFILLLVSIVLSISRWLMGWYVAPDYYNATIYLPSLLIGAMFLGYASYFGVYISTAKQSKLIATSSLIAAVVNIILNFLLIPTMGPLGAAISTCISYGSIAFYRLIKAQGLIKTDINYKRLILSIAIIIVQGLAVTADWHYACVSLITIGVLIVLYKNEAFTLTKTIKGELISRLGK